VGVCSLTAIQVRRMSPLRSAARNDLPATVDLGGSGGDLASLVDLSAPSPPAPLGVTLRGGEPGPSAVGPV
jgi:hypothetical protein